MGDFIENGTLAGPMADAKPLPASANPNVIPNLTAARWNAHRSALLDLREHTSGFVNVRSYGAKGDGVTDDYAALSAMVTALGSTNATLIVPGPCLVGTDLTIPSNLVVRFLANGAFTGAGTVTYTGEPANAATLAAAAGAALAKTAAETARDAANATGKVYPDTASGIAGVADGEYFSVPAPGSSESLILYRRSGAAAVEAKRYPTADAVLKPTWTGRRNGWPDPFFRKFGLTSQTFLGRDRWYWNGTGAGELAGWSRVSNPVFDGYALRRAAGLGTAPLNGPVIHLDEIGAVEGDTITVYALFVGDGAGVLAPGRFDTGTDNANLGVQLNPISVLGNTWVDASATPQWLRHVQTVPAGATRFKIYAYTNTAGETFDLVAMWAFKGAASAGPDWPIGAEEAYYRTRDDELLAALATEIVLPPTFYVTEGRELSIYFDNITPAADARDFAWEVTATGIAPSVQQAERWTYVSAGSVFTTSITIAAHSKTSGSQVASGNVQVKSQATAAGTGLTPKCIFIGDSLTAAGTYTGELVTIAATDALKIALHGTRGSGTNKHEGRSGWKIDNYVTNYTDGASLTNPFWNVGAGAVDFPNYLTANAIPVPDWVFVMLGTNDVFNETTDAAATAKAATEFAKLDTLIASIKAAGVGVKVGLMTPPPPSFDQDAFAASYNSGQSRWRFKRNLLLWNKALIAKYGAETANRIYVVPTHVNLDTVNNMSRAAAAPVNSRSTVTVQRQNNGVHPATEGYYQIADTVWAFLKNQF
jgi:lysophospholipase L1-like esterase